ncbi:beta/gamma crystallin domain-containing protein [Streptomyces sp. NBC_01477]|uniref:beta/gamma crystallin domain-containing protein n=1 Tax=Streptomyces sp. NBC_01477 TaxID=2976015 RepID=UPI002E314BC4|nr:beta/gamma crystallin domain-containing protein [Streptomyces sp. NBC_01477]
MQDAESTDGHVADSLIKISSWPAVFRPDESNFVTGGPVLPVRRKFSPSHPKCRTTDPGGGRSIQTRTPTAAPWPAGLRTRSSDHFAERHGCNNDLIYYDANGDSVKIERWHDITFPNRPPQVSAIQIL